MSNEPVTFEEEMTQCPECEGYLSHGTPDFLGEGLMVIQVFCDECSWNGTEEWVHDQTFEEA